MSAQSAVPEDSAEFSLSDGPFLWQPCLPSIPNRLLIPSRCIRFTLSLPVSPTFIPQGRCDETNLVRYMQTGIDRELRADVKAVQFRFESAIQARSNKPQLGPFSPATTPRMPLDGVNAEQALFMKSQFEKYGSIN